MSYDKDYVKYDNLGLKEVTCMKCNTIIARRTYIEIDSKTEINKKEKVLTLKKLSNWKQVKVKLSDGSFAEPMFCLDCSKQGIDCEKTTIQIKKGWEIEMKALNRNKKDIEKFKKIVCDLKITEEVKGES